MPKWIPSKNRARISTDFFPERHSGDIQRVASEISWKIFPGISHFFFKEEEENLPFFSRILTNPLGIHTDLIRDSFSSRVLEVFFEECFNGLFQKFPKEFWISCNNSIEFTRYFYEDFWRKPSNSSNIFLFPSRFFFQKFFRYLLQKIILSFYQYFFQCFHPIFHHIFFSRILRETIR